MKPIFAALTLLLAALAVPPAAAQAPKVGDKFGDWNFNCRAVGQDKTVCGLFQIVSRKTESGSTPIMNLTIRRFDVAESKARRTALAALLPLGIYLPAGVGARIDEGKPFALVPQSCVQAGCEAAVLLDDATLTAMKGGKELFVTFRFGAQGKAITLPASLAGMTKGLAALK